MPAQAARDSQISSRSMRSSCCCMGVSGGRASPASAWIRPISVAWPVAVTTARPEPPVTAVPLKTRLLRSPRGRSRYSSVLALLLAGTDSPVSSDSSRLRDWACRIRPSVAIMAPGASKSTSPGTISGIGTWRCRPSRSTAASGAATLPRLEMVRSASRSVAKPMAALTRLTTAMAPASSRPPVSAETAAEPSSRPVGRLTT